MQRVTTIRHVRNSVLSSDYQRKSNRNEYVGNLWSKLPISINETRTPDDKLHEQVGRSRYVKAVGFGYSEQYNKHSHERLGVTKLDRPA